MNLNVLLEEYLKDNRIFQIADRLVLSKPQRIFLKNLNGSASQFVFGSVFRHDLASQLNHLVILNDAEEAAYFHNTLENLTSALNAFYFPSSFKNRKNYRQLNASHVMLRTEMLTRFSTATGNRVGAVVTYPEALFEKVVLPKTLSGNIIRIKAGDSINVSELLSQFVDYGFERTDFVYEPGQFALRGGILDIYSFGNEKPYRIELFGNDVDSIRIFDPETQLSERKLLQVTIIPNVETQFDTGEKVSLLEFLPDNTAIWVQDWDVVKEKLNVQEEDLEIFFRVQETAKKPVNDDDNLEKKDVTGDDFVPVAAIEEQLQLRHMVEFGHTPHFGGIEITFDTREQPSFNRQFDFLIRDLKSWEAKQYHIYLFAENPRQLERVHSIFADLKAEIQFTPIPISIHGGFIAHDLKVVCYTDHQIFQRYHKYRVKQAYNKNKALTLRALRELQPGDYVTHIDHGVGI
ncbi:MAG TPA: transcription-repair coupling factor, partial [Agriterribacter sp.]|nr:transcription-repair coupling factor [Agriterribacter sp.]